MTSRWEPYREPLSSTLARTVGIAIVLGVIMASLQGGLSRFPEDFVLALWPAFGGHWLELWFLNWLRPRLPQARLVQIVARLGMWFFGGILLWYGMKLTAAALAGAWPVRWPAWWVGPLAFPAIELVAHFFLWLRRRPNFYSGTG